MTPNPPVTYGDILSPAEEKESLTQLQAHSTLFNVLYHPWLKLLLRSYQAICSSSRSTVGLVVAI